MAEPFLLVLFKVIWQDLVEDVNYNLMKKSWQVFLVLINESKNNKQVGKDLAVALEKCFYSSIKKIAEKCRDELIKKSTFTQYRGAKIYNPPENDKDIRSLEKKIKLLEKQLKQVAKKKSDNQVEELLSELHQSKHNSSVDNKEYIDRLFEEAEKDCDANIYKIAIRDEKNGLRQKIFNSFLINIGGHERLNSIFDAKTYLMLNKIR